ncbi:unnamed protein product [Prunus armeniaca]|uniref:Uncharacterized protein n=1 Tax=Prunus armeniaca TaxID=36596 RepID=A0A6J5XHB9_PRUAR|nr:unnamed protein product [Prunus armeniaca]CAB4311345.1 unnamed protein product [Prunus armeniaca]
MKFRFEQSQIPIVHLNNAKHLRYLYFLFFPEKKRESPTVSPKKNEGSDGSGSSDSIGNKLKNVTTYMAEYPDFPITFDRNFWNIRKVVIDDETKSFISNVKTILFFTDITVIPRKKKKFDQEFKK